MEIKSTTDSETVSKVLETVYKINEVRAQWNRQALINVFFLYGKQHFTLNRVNSNFSAGQRIVWEIEKSNKPGVIRRTSNILLPPFRSVFSRMLRQKANVHAEPTTSTQKDRDAARFSKEVAEDFWNNCNRNNPWLRNDYSGMQSIFMKLLPYQMTIGLGYLTPYFNPKSMALVYTQPRFPGDKGEVIESDVGNAEVRVISPLNMFKDRFQRFATERRFLSPEQVWDEYGVECSPSEVNEDDTEVRIRRTLEGASEERLDKDGVYIYRKLCAPSKEYPEGRELVVSDKEIIYDEVLPSEARKRIQIYEFKYQDLGFTTAGQGCIEQCIDLQEDFNFTLSRIAQHKKMLTGKVLVPKGSDISSKFDDVVGQIIYYVLGKKPTMESAPPVPDYFYKELMRIRATVEDLMNSHDSTMGRDPSQVKSGIGISNLSDLDNAQIAPELIMLEQKLGFFTEAVLDICQEKYTERRLLKISGEDMAFEVKSFIGSDLFGQKNIQIKMGSNFPLDKNERTQYILMLKKEGFIAPDRAKELLEFTDIDGSFKTLDENCAKQDILNIIEGQGNFQVQAENWEDHTIFLKVINDFRKGTMYPKLDPQVKAEIDDLASQHQQMLLDEQKAMAAQQAQPQKAAPLPKQPSESINFKDLPIDGKIQVAAQAGINLDPRGLVLQEHMANKDKQPKQPGAGQGAIT